MEKKSINIVEVWGGIECSYNRVKNKFFDQLDYAGHYRRVQDDVAKFSELGIKQIRYPIIWERMQPDPSKPIDWTFTDLALNELQSKNIEVIAGLVHHGSGPKFADMATRAFAPALAGFAARVAERYPHIRYFTPVNEPLTTARFSSLYGLWYPHKRNDRTFVRVLLHELAGVVMSMRAIRAIRPDAQLVQTEDLAKIYSTPFMAYQAKFENHRRWLTYDILCGRLKPGHALWSYFKRYAEAEADLRFFIDNPCPPDILGLDYYPTSERYLDENLSRYPVEKHGRNHRHRYADVEAFRVRLQEPYGIRVLLDEVWQRYQLPMAVTEVHINCDCDNQVRWFSDIRNACMEVMQHGVDVRGITTWAMLGSYGWNRLLTSPGGDYEPGAFDVSGGTARRTALGDFVATVARDPNATHPALEGPGWWHDDARFLFERDIPEELVPEGPVLDEDYVER